jgi:putative transposase
MKRSRFTEEQIIAILQEQESGIKTTDLTRIKAAESADGLDLVHKILLCAVGKS